MNCPYNFFLGRILNRFSKDVGAMDELLPRAMLEALQVLTMMFGILVMVVIVNYWMIIPAVVMLALFYIARGYYLRTAQNLKRLEGVGEIYLLTKACIKSTTALQSNFFQINN